ncbi:MAG: type II toxin-antitoxin system VapC family toxin [Planctomycetes bacterium]|nr:type II toxin-antitoxin system VapC family toxin [Planctomycetota bacterium]
MERAVVIDTNVLIREIREVQAGRAPAVLSRHPVILPVAAFAEFLCGLENGRAPPDDRRIVAQLLESETCDLEPFDALDAASWARIRASYFPKGGRAKDATDLFIVAQAVSLQAPFISDNDESLFRQLQAAGEIEWYRVDDVIAGRIAPETNDQAGDADPSESGS